MKLAFGFVLGFIAIMSFAQPQGKLFLQSGFINNHTLKYIQYPSEQSFFIDSTEIDCMIWAEGKLLVTNDKIYSYELPNFQKNIFINTDNALNIAKSNDFLAVTKANFPYFEVYSFQNKNLLFSLDSNKISKPIVDLLISSNRAYLLFDKEIAIVDLIAQDTLAIISTEIHPFSFVAYNEYLFEREEKIYIDVELATGVPRFCLLSLDKNTLQLNLVLFKEGIDTPFKPVLADDVVYMSIFPSHYNFSVDSFYFYQNQPYKYAIDFDKSSKSVFVYSPINQTLNYWYQNTYSNSISITTFVNYNLFVDESPSIIAKAENSNFEVSIFPNPANKYLNIYFNEKIYISHISIIDIKGQKISYNVQSITDEFKIDLENYIDGVYIIEIVTFNQTSRLKFIKN